MVPYLVFGSGEGVAIDQFVTRDANSRLVFVRTGKLYVSDSVGNATELPGADVRDDGISLAEGRAATMTGDGTRLIYFRHGKTDQVVIREVASGHERVIAVNREIWRASIDLDGHWALVALLKPGAKFPVEQTDRAGGACHGPAMAAMDGGLDGDEPIRTWLDVDRGVFVDANKVPEDVRSTIGKRPRHRAMRGLDGSEPSTLYCSDQGCRDTATHKKIALPRGHVVYAYGNLVVVSAHNKLTVFDAAKKTTTSFPEGGAVRRRTCNSFRSGTVYTTSLPCKRSARPPTR